MKTTHYKTLLNLYKNELSDNKNEDTLHSLLSEARVARDTFHVLGQEENEQHESEYINELEQLIYRV